MTPEKAKARGLMDPDVEVIPDPDAVPLAEWTPEMHQDFWKDFLELEKMWKEQAKDLQKEKEEAEAREQAAVKARQEEFLKARKEADEKETTEDMMQAAVERLEKKAKEMMDSQTEEWNSE